MAQITQSGKFERVDVVDVAVLDSALTVKNYLTFYAMAARIYKEQLPENMEEILCRAGSDGIMFAPVNELTKVNRVIVRSLIAHLKHADCLVGEDALEDLDAGARERLLDFFKSNFVNVGCMCVLLEKEHVAGDDRVDEIIRL